MRVGEIRFRVYPQDHEPIHVHGFIGSGEVIVMLFADGTVGLDDRDDAVRRATRSESRKVLAAANEAHAVLVTAWKEMHPDE